MSPLRRAQALKPERLSYVKSAARPGDDERGEIRMLLNVPHAAFHAKNTHRSRGGIGEDPPVCHYGYRQRSRQGCASRRIKNMRIALPAGVQMLFRVAGGRDSGIAELQNARKV